MLKRITDKRKKTDADREKMAEIEFKAGLYIDEAEGPVLPGDNVEATIHNAAKITKEGKLAKSACFVPAASRLEYDGPRDVEGLWSDERFRNCVGVKQGQARIMRTRPWFKEWAATVEVHFEDSIVNVEQVERWVHSAGTQVGIGDWRPKFGRFSAEMIA